MIAVKYLDQFFKDFFLYTKKVKRKNGLLPGQDENGYGPKIKTDDLLIIGKRKYRVYTTSLPKISFSWVKINNEIFHI